MKYLDEFSDPDLARKLVDEIKAATSQRWSIMEVCGGQTHSIIRHGIDQLLPDTIEMIHGPGCPVCVTPLEIIDKALEIASRPDVIFCSFGDMLRVPGSEKDLFQVKSEGGDVRVVYSPLDALTVARENPDKQVVFFGIGFETTAPANAMTVYQAKRLGIKNYSTFSRGSGGRCCNSSRDATNWRTLIHARFGIRATPQPRPCSSMSSRSPTEHGAASA